MTVYVLALTLWFRVDWHAPLVALPLWVFLMLELIPPIGDFLHRRVVGKLLGWLLTLSITALYWTMQRLGDYTLLGEYLKNLIETSGSYQSLYTYATSIGSVSVPPT